MAKKPPGDFHLDFKDGERGNEGSSLEEEIIDQCVSTGHDLDDGWNPISREKRSRSLTDISTLKPGPTPKKFRKLPLQVQQVDTQYNLQGVDAEILLVGSGAVHKTVSHHYYYGSEGSKDQPQLPGPGGAGVAGNQGERLDQDAEEDGVTCGNLNGGPMKVAKRVTESITPNGITVSVSCCSIEYPQGAFETETLMSAKAEIDSSKCPRNLIVCTPMLTLGMGRPRVPVRIKLPAWSVPPEQARRLIMYKPLGSSDWQDAGIALPVTNDPVYEFDWQNFNCVLVGGFLPIPHSDTPIDGALPAIIMSDVLTNGNTPLAEPSEVTDDAAVPGDVAEQQPAAPTRSGQSDATAQRAAPPRPVADQVVHRIAGAVYTSERNEITVAFHINDVIPSSTESLASIWVDRLMSSSNPPRTKNMTLNPINRVKSDKPIKTEMNCLPPSEFTLLPPGPYASFQLIVDRNFCFNGHHLQPVIIRGAATINQTIDIGCDVHESELKTSRYPFKHIWIPDKGAGQAILENFVSAVRDFSNQPKPAGREHLPAYQQQEQQPQQQRHPGTIDPLCGAAGRERPSTSRIPFSGIRGAEAIQQNAYLGSNIQEPKPFQSLVAARQPNVGGELSFDDVDSGEQRLNRQRRIQGTTYQARNHPPTQESQQGTSVNPVARARCQRSTMDPNRQRDGVPAARPHVVSGYSNGNGSFSGGAAGEGCSQNEETTVPMELYDSE